MVNTAPEAHLHGFRGCFVVVPLWWRSPLARIEKCLLSSFGEWLVPVWFPIRMQMAEPRNGLCKLLALSGLRCWCADFSVAERGKTMAKILEICLLGCFCGLRNVPFGVMICAVWPSNTASFAMPNDVFCIKVAALLSQNGPQGAASFLFCQFVAMLFSAHFLYISDADSRLGFSQPWRLVTVQWAWPASLVFGVLAEKRPLGLHKCGIFITFAGW